MTLLSAVVAATTRPGGGAARATGAEAPGAALTLRDLVKCYGDRTVVDGVSLDIRPGEFVTLLGPSGSGKTTTLNAIAGFAELTAGEILMDGRPIEDLQPHRRDIGVVFQHYALFPHMTAAQNVAFPLRRRRVPKAEIARRVASALEMVRLADLGDRYPAQLSGGQQQRIALARALVFEPRILLMDEPLGALDKKLREWLQLEIKRIHEQLGITFIYVTHDQEEALVLSDRIAVFCDGRIEQLGTAAELYEQPRTVFVAEFLGESNVFKGRHGGVADAPVLSCDGFELRLPDGEAVAAGAPGAVMVRPERVRLLDAGVLAGGSENVLEGHVRQIIYLGSARKLEVDLSNGQTLIVREAAGEATRELAAGDPVALAWSASDSVRLAA